jgi:hypothetical protein
MTDALIFPDQVVFFRNLMLQRTNVLVAVAGQDALTAWLENGRVDLIDNTFKDNEARRKAYQLAESDMQKECRQILGMMGPAAPRHFVSIGPGNSLLEALLLRQWCDLGQVTLIDIEQTESHQHGFSRQGSGYASLENSRRFLAENGTPIESISLCNPLHEPLPNAKFDLLISILSMGFHYPCDDYADYIIRDCEIGGLIVIDARKNAPDNGLRRILASGFAVERTHSFAKFERVLLKKVA